MKSVGIREAKARLSELARAAAKGQATILTDYGKPVAVITPIEQTTEEESASDAGKFREAFRRLPPGRCPEQGKRGKVPCGLIVHCLAPGPGAGRRISAALLRLARRGARWGQAVLLAGSRRGSGPVVASRRRRAA